MAAEVAISDVEFSEEEKSALFTADQPQTPEKKDDKTDSKAQTTESEEAKEAEEEKVTIDGEEYTLESIRGALSDSKNKSDWSKSNTQKAQEIAEKRKMVDGLLQLKEKMKSKPDFWRDFSESIEMEFGEDGKALIAMVDNFDPEKFPHPLAEEIKSIKSEKENLEAEVSLMKEVKDFRKSMGLTELQADKVLEFAIEKYNDTGIAYSLEDAYKLMNFDKIKEKAESLKPPPKVPSGQGAQTIKSKDTGDRIEDIDISEYAGKLII